MEIKIARKEKGYAVTETFTHRTGQRMKAIIEKDSAGWWNADLYCGGKLYGRCASERTRNDALSGVEHTAARTFGDGWLNEAGR